MKVVRLTPRKLLQLQQELAKGHLVERRLRRTGQTDTGVVYECLDCGDEHEVVAFDEEGTIDLSARTRHQGREVFSGYCPCCSPVA